MAYVKTLALAGLVLVIAYFVNDWKNGSPSLATVNLNSSYDYIVVGAGSAGSVLAARLSEDPDVSVLLLEAGGDYNENSTLQVPILSGLTAGSEYDWAFKTEPQEDSMYAVSDRKGNWPRGRVLGGTSAINGMEYGRGFASDYDEWESLGCDGWGYEEVLPYFMKSEDILVKDLQDSNLHGKGGPLAVSTNEITPLKDVYMKAGIEAGYNVVPDYIVSSTEGFSEMRVNIRNGVCSHTGIEFLGPTAGRQNLHIGIRTVVTRIEVSNKRATGVYGIRNGRKVFFQANKEVILSAGVVNSPKILMLSGIGPKSHLQQLNIPVVADLPVGEHLLDHVMVAPLTKINTSDSITLNKVMTVKTALQYLLFGDGYLGRSGLETIACLCSENTKASGCIPDLQMLFFSNYLAFNVYNLRDDVADEYLAKSTDDEGFSTALINVEPKSVGRIRLASSDPFDHPAIDPRHLSDDRDVDVLVKGLKLWERILETPSMKAIGASVDSMKLSCCSQHVFRSDAYWQCFVRHLGVTAHHAVGTCKMGKAEDPTAVVDPKLRVRGLQGLRVVDASVMPTHVHGGPNAPVIMIAEKAADIILERKTVKP